MHHSSLFAVNISTTAATGVARDIVSRLGLSACAASSEKLAALRQGIVMINQVVEKLVQQLPRSQKPDLVAQALEAANASGVLRCLVTVEHACSICELADLNHHYIAPLHQLCMSQPTELSQASLQGPGAKISSWLEFCALQALFKVPL